HTQRAWKLLCRGLRSSFLTLASLLQSGVLVTDSPFEIERTTLWEKIWKLHWVFQTLACFSTDHLSNIVPTYRVQRHLFNGFETAVMSYASSICRMIRSSIHRRC